MFSKATANFVHQIDPEGSLIHVSRLNDSQKLVPMALVVKRNRFWFWQRPKYQPTHFILSDLLLGDKVLSPGLRETEFLTYKGTFGDKLSGKLDTKAGSVSVALEGRGTSKLQSCFNKLKKEELNVKKLLCDSRSRLVDMQHVLVQQLEKQADVLAIVKERIVTTNSCAITQTKKEQCIFQGMIGLLDILGSSVKVCVRDSNNIEMDSDVSLEIPSDTVIAYSILELEIKKDGHYDICLQPGMTGGFESDSWPSRESLNTVDGKCNGKNGHEKTPLSPLQNGSQEMDLCPLAELCESTRHALFKKLQETMRDRTVLSYLQYVLEESCSGEALDTDTNQVSSDTECSQSTSSAHLNAAHLLVSAMAELPDETLSILCESHAEFLKAFDTLMCTVKENSGPLSIQCLPVSLQDNQALQLAEQLLSSTNVTLKRDADWLWMETGNKVLFLLLRLITHGLSLLCNGKK